MVKPKHRLAHHVDEQRIADAIRSAEAGTTAKIVVTLAHHAGREILAAAMRAFMRLEMHRADKRNNVLFYVAPLRREFAIVGDAGAHDALGQGFWDELALSMSAHIKTESLTDGLCYGIDRVGRELSTRFPRG
ncbi:MAG TPA: TPM domain-containing protein [Candidatus Acidoferrales bacterium]|nr:TPM domain-containing protein [Candidatus Acidoferrales bacterium]